MLSILDGRNSIPSSLSELRRLSFSSPLSRIRLSRIGHRVVNFLMRVLVPFLLGFLVAMTVDSTVHRPKDIKAPVLKYVDKTMCLRVASCSGDKACVPRWDVVEVP